VDTLQVKRGGMKHILVAAACMSALLVYASPANAQAVDPQMDSSNQPLSATTKPAPTDTGALPDDLGPEKLEAPRTSTVPPARGNRNRWDPATLTQSTGLSAASIQQAAKPEPVKASDKEKIGEGVLGSDLLTVDDLLNVGEIALPEMETAFAAPSREDGVINLSTPLRGALFDSPTDNVNASVFKLDLGDRLCLGTAEECKANEFERIDVGYAKNITHGKFDGLNLQLTPRAGLRFDEGSKSALVGALVRIGDNLREGSEMKSNTWYFFAGADAEAVTYTPTGMRRLTSGEFHLQDRIIVGDAQAGLGYRLGSADLALTYYKRQAKAENYSYDEDAAALSLTWKR